MVDPTHRAHSMLVLQWPESLCASEKRGCIGTVHPYFTMHGVWPIERHLVNCRADFEPEQLAALASNLTAVWPSYFHRTSMSFWKHGQKQTHKNERMCKIVADVCFLALS